MNNRYIEIDSTYRNRNEWPLPGEFEVLISQSGTKGRYDAVDPVSRATPLLTWTSNLFNQLVIGNSVVVSITTPPVLPDFLNGLNTENAFVITAVVGTLQQKYNYYVGATVTDGTQYKKIIRYAYAGVDSTGLLDRAFVLLDEKFASLPASITIYDPTDVSNTSKPYFFVPSSESYDNYYYGYFLYNETLNEYREISYYDNLEHMISLKIDGTGINLPITGWSVTDNYSIREEIPNITGTIGAPTASVIPLINPSLSTVNNFYYKFFLRLTSGPVKNEIRTIISYDGATTTATVYPSFSSAPIIGDTFEILAFSYDNSVPFSYSGSLVSQQEEVCYEIELLNVVLPNKTLKVGIGSRIAYYPYVYVEFSNISSAGAGTRNIIYSNNPNSTKMLFRCAVDDIENPATSSFINLNGGGMKQTVKFKPNDSLKFSVRLSNGEIYETQEEEYYGPFLPNPNIQISALFSIRRL